MSDEVQRQLDELAKWSGDGDEPVIIGPTGMATPAAAGIDTEAVAAEVAEDMADLEARMEAEPMLDDIPYTLPHGGVKRVDGNWIILYTRDRKGEFMVPHGEILRSDGSTVAVRMEWALRNGHVQHPERVRG